MSDPDKVITLVSLLEHDYSDPNAVVTVIAPQAVTITISSAHLVRGQEGGSRPAERAVRRSLEGQKGGRVASFFCGIRLRTRSRMQSCGAQWVKGPFYLVRLAKSRR